jgi:hypothetical protein
MRSNPVSWRGFRQKTIWSSFLAGSQSFCQPAPGRVRRRILVQCFMRFRVCCPIENRTPVPEFDRHTHDLANDFRLLGIT